MLNNLEEYNDPHLYDAEYGGYQGDLNLFLNLVPKGNVLDLGCGTGRLAIPLTDAGFHVTALDASSPMLELARQKAQNFPIECIHGDMRDFHLQKRFDLIIMAGNTFQALLTRTDQRRLLSCVRDHLKETGVFVFNTRNPQRKDFKNVTEFEFWHTFQDTHGKTAHVYGKQEGGASQQCVTYITKRVWDNKEMLSTIRLRFTPYSELMELLSEAGFEVGKVYGDDQESPFSKDSTSIIPVCRLRRAGL